MKRMIINNQTLKIKLLKNYLSFIFNATRITNGKGYGFLTRLVKKLLAEQIVCGNINPSSQFCFNLLDDYWNQLIVSNAKYEPEIYTALEKLQSKDYVFIDAGANLGYWSVLVSSEELGNKQAIAIEASSTTFKLLQNNCTVNQSRFTCINNAISNSNGDIISFTKGAHAARHIDTEGNDTNTEEIKTITLDVVVAPIIKEKRKVIIKLDVEGAEINALKGAENIINNYDCLFIYEDHGNDSLHTVTDYIITTLGMNVYYYDNAFNKIERINELDNIKVNAGIGYNFFAIKKYSDFKSFLFN